MSAPRKPGSPGAVVKSPALGNQPVVQRQAPAQQGPAQSPVQNPAQSPIIQGQNGQPRQRRLGALLDGSGLTRSPAPAPGSQFLDGTPTMDKALAWGLANKDPDALKLRDIAAEFAPLTSIQQRLGFDAHIPPIQALQELAARLDSAAQHSKDTITGFLSRTAIEPVGFLHLERLEMVPVGVERGALVHSVPLTPGETVNISHREWSTTSQEFDSLVQDYMEGYSEQGVAEKTDLSQSTETQQKHSSALNFGTSMSASYASVTVAANFNANLNFEDQSVKKSSITQSAQVTKKASSRVKKDHKVSFKTASASGTEDQAVRTLTNPSTTDAMRVDYYQLMRKWRVNHYRYGLRMTYDIVVPNPGADLVRKIEDLRAVDAAIQRPFTSSVNINDITVDNWADKLAMFPGVDVDPLEEPVDINVGLNLPYLEKDQAEKTTFYSIEAEVDPRFQVDWATYNFDGAHIPDADHSLTFSVNPHISTTDDRSFGNLYGFTGATGRITIPIEVRNFSAGYISVKLKLSRKHSYVQAWRLKAWNAIRQAQFDSYQQQLDGLKARRAQLQEEVNQFDALTLRRMEREELMKAVLRWLFGPNFQLVPEVIDNLFKPLPDENDPLLKSASPDAQLVTLQTTGLAPPAWHMVMQYGEIIKFLHEAVEWENILYFLYPYFWDSPRNWAEKRFLNHPDPIHRDFLRAGSARVVLTIRPGFEQAFASWVESGDFEALPGDHPYMTVAQQIRAYDSTAYQGIPPANSNPSESDIEGAEKGELIGYWYEYVPTSALDVQITTAPAKQAQDPPAG